MENILEPSTRDYIFRSPSMLIGKTIWRFVVYRNKSYGVCTDYEFVRNVGYDVWEFGRNHPRWNGNDTYCGLPKTLSKLWEMYKCEFYKVSA